MKGSHLLLLVGLLGCLIAIGSIIRPPSETAELETQLKLRSFTPEGLKPEHVTAIELCIGRNKPSVVLEKAQKAWRIASGWNAPADILIVEKFLKHLFLLRGDKPVTDEKLHADFGVDVNHGMHVRLFSTDRDVPVVDLVVGGKRRNFYDNSFARLAAEKTVYQASIDIRGEVGLYNTELTKPPYNRFWLDTTPVDIERGSLKKIAISYPDHRLVFERSSRMSPMPDRVNDTRPPVWELVSGGPGGPVREDKLQRLIRDIERFNINDALDPSKKKDYGLDKPGHRLVITFTDDRELTVDASRSRGGRPYITISTMPGHLLSIPHWRFDEIFAKGGILFDLKRPIVKVDRLRTIVLTRLGRKLTLARKSEKEMWKTDSGDKLNSMAVANLLSALRNWQPDDYADTEGNYGFDAPRAVLEISAGGRDTFKLYLGKEHPTWLGAYVRAGDKGRPLVMEDADVKKIFPDLDQLKEK